MMYLKATLLSLVLFTGSIFSATAQTIDINVDNLKGQAIRMAQALVKKDYKTFIRYTHPVVINKMGGEEKMLKSLKAGVQSSAEGGYVLSAFDILNVKKIVLAGNEIHALLSDHQVMVSTLGTLSVTSYLLAISKDNGKNWLFVDAGGLTNERAKALFPNFNPELRIPPKQKPIYTRAPKQ